MVLTDFALDALLEMAIQDSGTPTDGPFLDCTVMLFTNNLVPTSDTLLADLTEATFTGYARSAATTFTGPHPSVITGVPALLGDQKVFTCSANGDEEIIYGYALVKEGAPDMLLGVELFETPWEPGAGNVRVVSPRVGLNPVDVSPGGDTVFE